MKSIICSLIICGATTVATAAIVRVENVRCGADRTACGLRWLNDRTAAGVNGDRVTFIYQQTVSTLGGEHLHFSAFARGFRVDEGTAVLTFDDNGQLRVASLVDLPRLPSRPDAELAVPVATAWVGFQRAFAQKYPKLNPTWSAPEKVWIAAGDQLELTLSAKMKVADKEKMHRALYYSLRTHQIIAERALSHSFDATARIFLPSPTVKTRTAYGLSGLVDNNDADSPELEALRSEVTLKDLEESSPGLHRLRNPFVSVEDFAAPMNGIFEQASPVYTCARNEPCFEATHAFYFIDTALRHLQAIGINAHPYQYAGGIHVDPQGTEEDNSWYSSEDGTLTFGTGGVDDAEDHDVVVHELGHAIHDWVTGGHLSQVEGLSEGIADYWALSFSRAQMNEDATNPFFSSIFNWDGHNEFWPGRSAAITGTYPSAAAGEIHDAGQLISTTLGLIRNELGRDTTDRLLWEGLALTSSNASQNDAMQAIFEADAHVNAGTNQTVIRRVAESKGYHLH